MDTQLFQLKMLDLEQDIERKRLLIEWLHEQKEDMDCEPVKPFAYLFMTKDEREIIDRVVRVKKLIKKHK